MRLRVLAAACVALVAVGSSASAQTATKVKLVSAAAYPGGEVTSYGYYPTGTPGFYVSPYSGIMNYGQGPLEQSVVLNCVDYFHDVNLGDVWEVKVTNLGDVSSGQYGLDATRFGGMSNALTLYKQAAWLTMQYDSPNPGSDPQQTVAIQSAIWNLFNSSAPDPVYAGSNTDYQASWWTTQSIAGGAALTLADLATFSILSDDGKYPVGSNRQEFLVHTTTTPEPATLALMLTGLVGIAGVVRQRRKQTLVGQDLPA